MRTTETSLVMSTTAVLILSSSSWNVSRMRAPIVVPGPVVRVRLVVCGRRRVSWLAVERLLKVTTGARCPGVAGGAQSTYAGRLSRGAPG